MKKRSLRLDREVLTTVNGSIEAGDVEEAVISLLSALGSKVFWICVSCAAISVTTYATEGGGCTGGTGTATCQCGVSNQASSPCC